MNSFHDNYNYLIGRLDEFIRKFYKNQLIRGVIYASAFSLAFFLVIATCEYFFRFSTTARTILFWSFVLINAGIIGRLVILPLIRLRRLGKIISHEQAATIIGNHFLGVNDKLLNTLQLKKQEDQATGSRELIQASINQKIQELRPVPFTSAINLGENKKYLRYLAIPIAVFVILFFSAPSVITESTARLWEHGRYFEKPAPFTFEILNKELKTIQQDDYVLDVKVAGNELPDNVYIEVGNNQYKLDKESRNSFHFLFKNVQGVTKFRLFGAGFYSKEYTLDAVPNPILLNFALQLDYPGYLGKPSETIQNSGDLIVPQGTRVTWVFATKNTRTLKLQFIDTVIDVPLAAKDRFEYKRTLMRNDNYALTTANEFIKGKDSVYYAINVIPDAYPTIEFEQQADSSSVRRYFFRGMIGDDYGFNKLAFHYRFTGSSDTLSGKQFTTFLPISKSSNREQFFHMWDMASAGIAPGTELEYYFEVWDNDGINGSKSARSQSLFFKAPSLKEMETETGKKNEALKADMKETMRKAQQMQKDIDDMNKRLVDKKELNWEDRKKMEEMLKNQRSLEQKLNSIKNENDRKTQQENEYKKSDPELLEKQKQLQELLDKIMTDELRKLMEELEKLMAQMDKQKVQEMMDKMKLNNKDMMKEMDRTMEIFKQLEFEQKLKESIDKLEELAKKEEELSKDSNDKNADSKQLEEKQKELTKEFQDLKKELKELDKKNDDLQFPNDFDNPEQDQQDIDKDMQDSEQQLGEQKNKKASQSQKSASDKMKKMSQKMQQMQSSGDAEQMEEDLNALRTLLNNLIKLSFDQESLMQNFKDININDPKYIKNTAQQRKLRDDTKMIEDSLFALSKRVPQLSATVNREISAVNDNMDKATAHLQDRQTMEARSRQQFAMTSVNNLALLLSEALDAMQKAMAESKPGSQQCQKPGSKPSSSGQMKDLQKQLNQRIKSLKDGMQNGSMGQRQVSEELARLAAEQEALRRELQKMSQENNKDGTGSMGNLDKIAKQMEETETDLVNKRITQETLKRQEDIITRLLESEKAERERDEEERRESREGKNLVNRNPAAFDEYKRLKMKETELLKTVPPSLNPFYKQKVNEYFQNINN